MLTNFFLSAPIESAEIVLSMINNKKSGASDLNDLSNFFLSAAVD